VGVVRGLCGAVGAVGAVWRAASVCFNGLAGFVITWYLGQFY
jgi:hypothetical protein